jgi:hypothetical protein
LALDTALPADDATDDAARRFATDTDSIEGVVDELTEVLRLSMEARRSIEVEKTKGFTT